MISAPAIPGVTIDRALRESLDMLTSTP